MALSDNCDTDLLISDVVITKVSSDEPEDNPGGADGNTVDDILIASDGSAVDLRRERQGSGNGRVYIIHLTIEDAAGNKGYRHLPNHCSQK